MPGSPYTDAEVRTQIDPTEIGGGSGYLSTLSSGEIWTQSDADVTVSTAQELIDAAVYQPSDGETYVVWVADGATIDMTDKEGHFSGGTGTTGRKVIAGNRGQNGADGPLIYSNTKGENSLAYRGGNYNGVFNVSDDVELFGLRFRGWAWNNWNNPEYPGYIPLKDPSEYYAELQRCLSVRTDDLEIHNCEFFGWATQAIYVGTRGTPQYPNIHHNDIHDCMQTAFGYAIDCGNGRPFIAYNYINACRHGVNGSGYSTAGWRCYNNVFGPSFSQHPVDMHSLSNNSTGSSSNYNSRGYHGNAGGRMVFRNNTVCCTRIISEANVQPGQRTPAIGIRGVPWPRSGDGLIVEDNRFEHDEVKGPRPSPGHQYSNKENYPLAVHQQWTRSDFNFYNRLSVDEYTPNFVFNNNQTNGSTSSYDPSVGAPVNLNGDTTVTRDLTIAVRDESDNSAISGADVELTDESGGSLIQTTGSNGNTTFTNLATGVYDMGIRIDGWSNISRSFTHNSTDTRTYRLERNLETVDQTFGAFKSDGTAITGVEVNVPGAVDPAGDTRTTNEFGRARFELWSTQWDVNYSHIDYYDISFGRVVDTNAGAQTHDYTLIPTTETRYRITLRAIDGSGERIPGATFDVPTSDQEARQTNSNGDAEFILAAGDYDLTLSAPGYENRTGSFSVTDSDATYGYTLAPADGSGGVDEDEDTGPTQPAGASFFEVCALETAADAQHNLPILVCNTGGTSGDVTVALNHGTAADPGEAIDRRTVNLNPGEARIIRLSVRMAYLQQSGEVDMVVHTADDSEEFSATSRGTVEEITGPGFPGTIGSGTLGGPAPRTLGVQRAHEGVTDPDIARVPNDWGITLENQAGERRHFTAIEEGSMDISAEHTQLSTWSATVPAEGDLTEWADNTRAWITLDEKIQRVGFCETATESTDGQRAHLEGRGPGAVLDTDSSEFETGGIPDYKAIENVVEAYAPDWEWTVIQREEPVLIPGNQTLTGSRIDIIKQLHEDWGYKFVIDSRRHKRAVSFPPRGATSTREFTDLDWERSGGSERVYNRVSIRGDWERDENDNVVADRYQGIAQSDKMIQARADEYGITEEQATETYHQTDASIESNAMAQARAEAKLAELVENDSDGGQITALAQRVNAGLSYPMPWDEDRKTGAWAAKFVQGSGISGIQRAFREGTTGGAITFWAKSTWSNRSEREMRMIAGIDDVNETLKSGRAHGLTTTHPDGLGLQIDTTNNTTVAVDAYPDDLPPDDEWIFLHYDWDYDGEFTVLRAGRNGTVTDTLEVKGRPRLPNDFAWIGRYNQDHYVGLLDMVSFWANPLSDGELNRLTAGGDISAEDLVARYPLEEGPLATSTRIHDIIGGAHGEAENLEWAGNPQPLESVSYDMGNKTMDLSFSETHGYADIERLEYLETEIERLKRRQQ